MELLTYTSHEHLVLLLVPNCSFCRHGGRLLEMEIVRCVGKIRERQSGFRPEAGGGEKGEANWGLIPHGDGWSRETEQYWKKKV